MALDVLYLTWNRPEFTRFSLQMLLDNTDWSLVDRLIVHDDGSDSEEGVIEILHELLADPPVELVLFERPWPERLGSPPAIMNWYIATYGDSEGRFAKIDSDIVVPPEWLNRLTEVMDRSTVVELLGMEAGRMGPPGQNGKPFNGRYKWKPASHIGGVGLMKTASFLKRPMMFEQAGRFGFTEWQHEYQPVRGWIDPDLLLCELGRVPFRPWTTHTQRYIANGWEREWPKYHEAWDYWWGWWPK